MHLEWALPALRDIKDAGDFIASDGPHAAKRMAERIQEAVEYLLEFPNMGRPGRVTGTKELIVSGTPFVVVYRVGTTTIQILRILHHARNWPSV